MPRRRSAPPAAARRDWLRALALLWGIALLLGHLLTFDDPIRSSTLSPTLLDALKHSAGIIIFTLLYRASWGPGGNAGGSSPNLTSLLVCGGWGGLCEIAQIWHPLRYFNWLELGLNTLLPTLVIGLWWLVEQVWE